MNSGCTEAIVLAGGRGERLRPLTFECPKSMIDIFGYPLLHYSMQWLKDSGIKRVVISCSYKHEVISQYFGNGAKFGLDIVYAIEDKPLGRGGGIKLASQQIENSLTPVLVINGDIITKLLFSKLLARHISSNAKITIVTVPLHSPYGIVEIDDKDWAVQFREKPLLPYWVNAGIYLINSLVLSSFPDQGDHEEILFPMLANQGQLHAYKFEGFWRAVDTIKDLEELKHDEAMLSHWVPGT